MRLAAQHRKHAGDAVRSNLGRVEYLANAGQNPAHGYRDSRHVPHHVRDVLPGHSEIKEILNIKRSSAFAEMNFI